jgi:protein-S-isoprenylcysteine O-methyltransferase Ste14
MEQRTSPPRIPPPAFMLVAALVMWALDRWVPLVHWIVPPWNRLGAVFAATGLAIDAAAVLRFLQRKTTVNPTVPAKASILVTDGVFRVSRNPMYLGLVLLLIGWALWLGSATPWLVVPLFVVGITAVQIVPEERALAERFGQAYGDYRRRVGRWIGPAVGN